MAYKSNHPLFRDLTDQEEEEFRQAARESYKPGQPVSDLWHPIYRDECYKITKESTSLVQDPDKIGIAQEYLNRALNQLPTFTEAASKENYLKNDLALVRAFLNEIEFLA